MIAAYQRISRADGDLGKDGKDKSNSIENQKELILRYISCKESLQNVPVMDFVDDGWLLKLVLVMITLPLLLAVWLAKWFVVFLHHCSAWFFYLLGSVLLATAVLSYFLQQSQGMEALQMLIGGFVIFMVPQVVGSMVILLELVAVMLRQVWYI